MSNKNFLLLVFLLSPIFSQARELLRADKLIKTSEYSSEKEIDSLLTKINILKDSLKSPEAKKWNKIKKRDIRKSIQKLELTIKEVKAQTKLQQTADFKQYSQAVKASGISANHDALFSVNPPLEDAIARLKKNRTYKDFYSLSRKKYLLDSEQFYLESSIQKSPAQIDQDIQEEQDELSEYENYLHSPEGKKCSQPQLQAIRTFIAIKKERIAVDSLLKTLSNLKEAQQYKQILKECQAQGNCNSSSQLEQAVTSLERTPTFLKYKKAHTTLDSQLLNLHEQLYKDQLDQGFKSMRFIDAIDFDRYKLIPNGTFLP